MLRDRDFISFLVLIKILSGLYINEDGITSIEEEVEIDGRYYTRATQGEMTVCHIQNRSKKYQEELKSFIHEIGALSHLWQIYTIIEVTIFIVLNAQAPRGRAIDKFLPDNSKTYIPTRNTNAMSRPDCSW